MIKSITSVEFIQRYVHPINGGYSLKWSHKNNSLQVYYNDKYVKDIVFDKICKLLYAYNVKAKWYGNMVTELIYTF